MTEQHLGSPACEDRLDDISDSLADIQAHLDELQELLADALDDLREETNGLCRQVLDWRHTCRRNQRCSPDPPL